MELNWLNHSDAQAQYLHQPQLGQACQNRQAQIPPALKRHGLLKPFGLLANVQTADQEDRQSAVGVAKHLQQVPSKK
jgi:hypothetical protein